MNGNQPTATAESSNDETTNDFTPLDDIDFPLHCIGRNDNGEQCDADLTADNYEGIKRSHVQPSIPTHTGNFLVFKCSGCGRKRYVRLR